MQLPHSPKQGFTFAPTDRELLFVYIRMTAQAIHEETIFVDASSGHLPIHTPKW